ncbi:25963_t:CDS:2 [Gigaspora margarita]|uniref:25963_t:CDS:1 n=1 Tax=Gigaspora margarita TaxID=4874 RepID=A0ABN7VZW5_GIGMA|nr:25963_t:CDS:2 [Gigaspora margarita]
MGISVEIKNLKNLEVKFVKENSIKKYRFSGDFSKTEQQIRTQIDMNINLIQQKKQIIDKYKEEIKLFLICLLVTSDRQACLNYRINSDKDYYNYYQSICGMKENNETFEECAIQETKKKMEPSKHDEWFIYELKDLKKYKLTDSLKINLEHIIDIIS